MARSPWVVHVRVRVRELEAAVQAYLTAREQAGKPPVEEDILHLVAWYTTFVDPPAVAPVEDLKAELERVRQRLRALTRDRRPWSESLCQDAESLLALIREVEPDYER